jgi:hypothetical protein
MPVRRRVLQSDQPERTNEQLFQSLLLYKVTTIQQTIRKKLVHEAYCCRKDSAVKQHVQTSGYAIYYTCLLVKIIQITDLLPMQHNERCYKPARNAHGEKQFFETVFFKHWVTNWSTYRQL